MILAACFAALALCTPSNASITQDPLFEPKSTPRGEKVEVVHLTEWPKLTASPETVKSEIERLRKARTPLMGETADQALTEMGAAVVPQLLPILGKERDLEAQLRIETVLEKITTAEHTRLLAPFFAEKAREVRVWSLKRCAEFGDVGIAKAAEDALTKAKALRAKETKPEAADYEVYCAALCTTSAGSLSGMDVLTPYVITQWGKKGVELRQALESVRNEEATALASKLVADADRKKKVAGLNMLAGCGTKTALAVVKPCLDDTDNSIRIAAINAMRGIVDGDLPIANLAVFEAIELAKKWKQRS